MFKTQLEPRATGEWFPCHVERRAHDRAKEYAISTSFWWSILSSTMIALDHWTREKFDSYQFILQLWLLFRVTMRENQLSRPRTQHNAGFENKIIIQLIVFLFPLEWRICSWFPYWPSRKITRSSQRNSKFTKGTCMYFTSAVMYVIVHLHDITCLMAY